MCFSRSERELELCLCTHIHEILHNVRACVTPNVLLRTVSDFSDVVHQRLIQEFLAETTDRLAGHELWKDATVSSHRHFLRAFFSRTPTIYISCKFTAVPTRLIHSYISNPIDPLMTHTLMTHTLMTHTLMTHTFI